MYPFLPYFCEKKISSSYLCLSSFPCWSRPASSHHRHHPFDHQQPHHLHHRLLLLLPFSWQQPHHFHHLSCSGHLCCCKLSIIIILTTINTISFLFSTITSPLSSPLLTVITINIIFLPLLLHFDYCWGFILCYCRCCGVIVVPVAIFITGLPPSAPITTCGSHSRSPASLLPFQALKLPLLRCSSQLGRELLHSFGSGEFNHSGRVIITDSELLHPCCILLVFCVSYVRLV